MMNFRKILHLSLALLSVLFLTLANAAEKPGSGKNDKQSLGKVSGTPTHQVLNINNITTWGRSDGESNHSPSADNGVYYPVGTGNVVYEDGMVFGSKQYLNAARTQPSQGQKIRVGGSTYLSNVGNKAGYVTGVGAAAKAASPDAPDVRYYKVRRDYYYMTESELAFDAYTRYEHLKQSESTQSEMDAVKAQYDTDWKNWPVALGAPYLERNGKAGYQAPPAFGANFNVDSLIAGNYDEPGVGDPNTPADQVMWTAYNDLDKAQSLRFEGSEPQGIEIQVTTWGYKRTDAMGNCYFKRVKLTNKGGVDLGAGTFGAFYLDSMYVCQWSDIDLGDAADDLAGCDSARSMAYVYNGNAVDKTFAKFGLAPPSSGYDFLAGPTVTSAGDSAVVDFKRVYGKKNLPMSGFSYFSAGSPYSDPGFANYPSGTGQWWNMLRGYAPLGTITDPPVVYAYPSFHYPTKFPLSGDPTKGIVTGNFVDGAGTSSSFVMGDRRILLNTGPFNLDPGESQEVYVGFVVGIGADRLSSVSVMKASDNAVQQTFDLLFKVAKAPAAPVVKFSEMDGEVILDWGNNSAAVAATENKIAEPGHYTFEGYNVYQFPSAGATLASAKRIATYDVVNDVKVVLNEQFDLASGAFLKIPIQFGSDAGVKRIFRFSQDNIRDVAKLYNGQEYYLGITAYSVTTVAGYVAALESSPGVITVVPKVPFGKVFSAKFGDTLKVTVGGASDGKAIPLVINPGTLTGDTYKVTFDGTKDPTQWSLINVTKANKVMLSGQTNQSGDDNYLFADGMMVKVVGPPPGMKEYQIPAGSRRFTWAGADWGLEGFNNAIGMAYNHWFSSSSVTPDKLHDVLLKLGTAAAPWDPKNPPNDPEYSFGYRYLRSASAAPAKPSFAPFIVNPGAGYAYQDFNKCIPFSAWDMNVTPPVRLAVGMHENNRADGLVDGVYFPGSSDNTDNTLAREFAFIFATPYTTTPDPALMKDALNNMLPIMWWLAVNRRGTNTFFSGDQFLIVGNKVNTSAVTYTFTSPAPQSGADLEKISAGKVGVFPNPYYASNTAETSRFDRFVTFNNLPKNAVIRIFSLAGHLVRTLQKSSDNQFMRWDLMNARNYPVASGIYIAYVDMPDIGVTKTVKFSVIQQQEVLDYY